MADQISIMQLLKSDQKVPKNFFDFIKENEFKQILNNILKKEFIQITKEIEILW